MNGRIINRRVAEQGTVCHCCRRYMDEGEEYEENIEVLHHVNESYNMCPNCLTFADMYDVYSTLDGCVTRRVDFLYEVAKEAKATGIEPSNWGETVMKLAWIGRGLRPWSDVFVDVRNDAVYMSYRAYSLLGQTPYLYPFVEDGKLIIRKGGIMDSRTWVHTNYPVEGKGSWPMVKLWSKRRNSKMYHGIKEALPMGVTLGAVVGYRFEADLKRGGGDENQED